MSANTDHFDIDLQAKILSLMCQDRHFLVRVQSFMQPFYFDSEMLVDLVRLVKDYYSNYGTNPTPLSLMVETKLFLQENKRKNTSKYFDMIENAFSDSLPERDYLIHSAFDFIKFQEVRNALYNSAELLETKKLDQIKKLMDKAFSISEVNKPVLKYRAPEVIAARYSKEVLSVIPTGLPELDKHLDNGGLGIGEFGLVVGFSGIGKSIILMMLGANGLRQRKKVLHITLENSKSKTEKRYDRNLMGKTKSMLYDNVKGLESFIQSMFDSHKCDLIVEYFPPWSLKPSELKSYIMGLKTEDDFEPELLILDSPYLMHPEFTRERKDVELGETIMMLRGIGGELEFPTWGGAQTQAGVENKKKVIVSDTGMAFSQVHNSDVVATLNRTAEEKRDHVLRINLGKNRDGTDDIVLRYITNWDQMRFRYAPEE